MKGSVSHKERKRERERERESESANSRTRYYLNIHDIPFSVERKTPTYIVSYKNIGKAIGPQKN